MKNLKPVDAIMAILAGIALAVLQLCIHTNIMSK